MKIRKHLSADGLFKMVKEEFKKVKDHRPTNVEISLEDALMSGFALFSLKESSLLSFDKRRQTPKNLKRVYDINQIPSDTQMRTIFSNSRTHDPRICRGQLK